MANVKISDLTAAAAALGTQEFEVNESGVSKKVTGAQIATYVEGEVSSNPTFTGVVSIDDGSASAPALTNTGDTNTGVYFPAADEVAIATGGTERLKVDSNGITNVNDLKVAGNSIATAGSLSNRNKIINGNFDIWQRGTSGTAGFVADRWATSRVGSTVAISQQSFTLGQTDVPNEPTYFLRHVVTSAAGSANLVTVRYTIESVRTFAGQTVTLSFWAKADATKNIAVEFNQDFGTGGSPSADVDTIGVTTINLTSSWQKFTVTATLPSISGKTLGTNNNDHVKLFFWFDAGSDYNSNTNSLGQQSGTFDIAQVQLEAGDVATPFEMRTYGQELALCQRYFEVNSGVMMAYITYKMGGPVFAVTKRAIPSLVFYSGSNLTGTQGSIIETNSSGAAQAVTGSSASTSAITLINTAYSSSTNMSFSFTADAEL